MTEPGDLPQTNDRLAAAERQLIAFRESFELLRTTTGDLDQVLGEICRRARALCDAEQSFIYLLDGDVLRAAATSGGSPEHWAYELAHPNAIDRRTLAGRVAIERAIVQIPDVLADLEYDYPEGQAIGGYRTLLGVPIVVDGEFAGLIGLGRSTVAPVSDEQLAIIGAFADQAAIAMRIARSVTDSRIAVEREAAIHEVLESMSRSSLDLDQTLRTVIELAVKLCRADHGDVHRRDGEEFRNVAMYGAAAADPRYRELVEIRRLRIDRGTALGRNVLERRTVQIDDVLADPEYTATDIVEVGGHRTILGVPMLRDGEVVGNLTLWRREVRPFSDREIALVETFAEQARIAVDTVELHATVERQREALAHFAPQVAGLLSSEEGERMLAGHRREISVLYSDLRGFTAFAETAEPEEVLGVLRQYHEAVGELTVLHGGTVEHFAGDGLMVFFNDPVPIDDHPRAALETALEMRQAFDGLAAGWRRRGYELGLGIGLTVGYASIGRIGFEGRYDYAAVGNAVILAARLSSAAAAGEILVSQRAFLVVEDLVDADEVEGLELKGFSRSITAYRVLGPRMAEGQTPSGTGSVRARQS